GFNSVMLGNGDGTFQSPILYSTSLFGGSFSYTNLVAADFNHDGRVDLVGFGVFNTVSLLLGNGDGTFGGAAQTNIDYQSGNGPNSLAVGDFNGDGGVDLAIANGGENSVSLYLSRPVIALFPVSVSFADEPVGLASAPLSVQVSNPGSVVLNIDSISSSGDFAQTNTCGSSVQPGASCTISVTFTPTLPGSRSGS